MFNTEKLQEKWNPVLKHDMDAVFRLADRITVLVDGAAIASGAADEISNNIAVKTAYLGSE